MSEIEPTLTEDELQSEIERAAALLQEETDQITADTPIDLFNGELLGDCAFPISAETYLPDSYVHDWDGLRQGEPQSWEEPLVAVQLKANQKFYTAVWGEIEPVTDGC